MKTLDEAIGCWTVHPEYLNLVKLAGMVSDSARLCKRVTLQNDPALLTTELELLRKRLESMTEVTLDAQRRLRQIIETKELARGVGA